MILRRLFTVSVLLAAAFSAAGQEGEAYFLSNRAFLDTFQGRTASAELSARKDDGKLISLSQSPDSYTAGAATESFFRVSDKLTFYGKMSWKYFQGKDMGSQILINPEYNPVNFLENSEDNKGTKKGETYNLTGGMSYRLGRRWAAGVGVNYTSADRTKIKDPRYTSIWMDIDAHAGIMFRATDKLLLGASLQYRNTLEQVRAGIYGTTDKQYYIQSDKGGFLGTMTELAGDYNHISTENIRPMSNQFWGIALQVALDGVLTSQIWARTRDGYFGRRSSTTATFFEFKGFEAGYDGKFSFPAGHALSLSASLETLNNTENKFRYITPTGKNTKVEYTGKDAIFNRTCLYGLLGYSWHSSATAGCKPRLQLGINMEAKVRTQKTTLYPLYRIQKVNYAGADIWGRFSFPTGKSTMSAELHALAGGGMGTPNQDGTVASASATSIRSFDTYLYRQFEYETAARAGACLAVTCTLPSFGKVIPYVTVKDRYITLLSAPQYLEGASRNTATITLGCNF